jgi:hypothetical protein
MDPGSATLLCAIFTTSFWLRKEIVDGVHKSVVAPYISTFLLYVI